MSWTLETGGHIYGDAETISGLQKSKSVLKDRVRAVLFDSAKELRDAIKAAAPYRGGNLKHSIRMSRREISGGWRATVFIAKPGFYGRFLSLGIDRDVDQLRPGGRGRLAALREKLGVRRLNPAMRRSSGEVYHRHLTIAQNPFFSGPTEALAGPHEAAVNQAVKDAVEGRG